MRDKSTLTALIELATAALLLFAQDHTKADFYLMVNRASRWGAEHLGKIALASEERFRREVS